MDVILTHEQADFDALAAMLAASMLIEESKAVLPNRLNRNTRKFLNLYGAELPFFEARDLAQEHIQQITLVDTQSLVTLKGVTKKTRVNVIDHHQEREDISSEWSCRIEKTGATTTILSEMLQEQYPTLGVVQATLLLLGIYEDTGSLTYASTTVRDVKVAAWLLEKGADLRIASEFLNPALSDDQRLLADRLLENAVTHTIHGKSVLVSSAEAVNMDEEISSIAHKLRDLLDPDALFLFVRTSEGIRLVARSTTDQINVGEIARQFGGGGHERASAALIPADEQKTRQNAADLIPDLLSKLQTVIRPSLTVARIMSKRPHLITPDTSLQEVAKLMQRYGYEGYPVVENERVIGLLTRRAVDRAINHKLRLNAGSLMEAGDHTLKSSDTIDKLQNLMASTGWGQIPVVDADTNKIIGIVTRTDLLKTLPAQQSSIVDQKNYADLLEKSLPAPRLALLRLIASFSHQAQQPVYIVGGFVRDLLLERPSIDFDIVVEGDALQLAHALANKFGGRVVSHKRFGTAKWQIKSIRTSLKKTFDLEKTDSNHLPDSVDFISARTEFYDRPSALPTVERSSIKLDLHRRDFTINTLALRLDGSHYGRLYDYWGGKADIDQKLIRVLHSLSYVDDPTRLLRAVRFEQRFKFNIEKRTLQLMMEARELLRQLSGERIRHEFDLTLDEDDPYAILTRLQELGFLSQIHPELRWEEQYIKPMQSVRNYGDFANWGLPDSIGNTPIIKALSYITWLIPFGEKASTAIGERLRLSSHTQETIRSSIKIWQDRNLLISQPPSQVSIALEKTPIYGLYCLYCLADNPTFKDQLEQYVLVWKAIQPVTNGNTLRDMSIPPGPRYSQILTRLRAAWLDGEVINENEELELLKNLLK